MQKSDLTEIEIEIQDLKLKLARPGKAQSIQEVPAYREVVPSRVAEPASPEPVGPSSKEDPIGDSFDSPMVGTFYRKPSPDDAAFVQVGDHVKKGDALCIIEAMKVMNEIQADFAGEIIDILEEDGSSVEYGQPLFKIRKN
tara:strand:+ start:77 stop:499 length:423 start_codon:yes stop_codon:yes gene_type:complete